MSETVRGRVKWFNGEKGFGFVQVEGLDKDVFLHVKQLRVSGIEGGLTDGESISFVCNTGPKGFFATSIVRNQGEANASG